VVDIYDLLDACLWSFITMAFLGGMLRASNLISRTPSCFNPTEQLIRRCVIFTKEGLLLRLPWSKTRPLNVNLSSEELNVSILKF
jgi:hypothetical protein